MNENNVDYLVNQVKFTGFGDSLEFKIKENIAKGDDGFQLTYKPEFGKEKAEATLNFRKSEQGNYFFNSYELAIQKDDSSVLKQSFPVSSSKQILLRDKDKNVITNDEDKPLKEWVNSSFTLKEAFNMMEGRSVLKDSIAKKKDKDDKNEPDIKQTQWNKIDFSKKDKYDNYVIKHMPTYELETILNKYPIKDFQTDPTVKKELLDSLEKGNRQGITMVAHDGAEEKRSIEANAQFKTITQYIGNQRISNEVPRQAQGESQSENQAEDQSSKKNATQKTGSDDADDGKPAQKENKKKGLKAA